MDTTIKHNGIVERIKDGIIYVKITQHSACAECQASAMCTASEKKEKIIEIVTPANETFREKEEVLVCGKSSLGLLAVVYAFIVPVFLIVSALILTQQSTESETTAAIVGVITLAIYYYVLYLLRNNLKKKFIFSIEKLNQ